MSNTKNPVNIILCDLTYDTLVLVSDTIPINIGFIGAYAKKKFGETVSTILYAHRATREDIL